MNFIFEWEKEHATRVPDVVSYEPYDEWSIFH